MRSPEIENRLAGFLALGLNCFKELVVKEPEKLREYISAEVLRLKEEFSNELPPGFSNSRALYRAAGVDPTKHRPSSEALYRRVKKGLEFPDVNDIVNMTNLLSLKFQVPFGLYNTDRIRGKIVARKGGEGESYGGIRKERVGLNGKILLSDELGPFGNPSSDSLRTSVVEDAGNIMQVLFFLKSDSLIEKIMKETLEIVSGFFSFNELKSFVADPV